jgi:hypothetical protein
MPYYRSIPGVTASYIDGSFPTAEPSGEPRIIILGTSETGQTYNLFQIIDFAAAASEFGATSELYRAAVEARRQYPGDQNVNIALMRIGGRQGSVVLTDSQATPATLQIRPITRDATVLENYHLIMTEESSPIRQRILLYDNVKGDFVYDSDLVESQDEGVIDVIDGGLDIYTTTTGTVATPTAGPLLSALVPGDFALGTGASAFGSVVVAAGSEGTSMTNI